MKKITIFFILLFVCNSLIYSANQTQTNLELGTYTIGATTAVINLNINENQTITVFKDTLLFEEDFNNFLNNGVIGTSTVIGGENVLTVLPSSMTKMPGCKARTVKVNEENACNIYDTSSKFRTPILSIPDNSILSFRIKNGQSKKQELRVNDTIYYISKGIDSIKTRYLSSATFIEFGKQSYNTVSLFLDSIKIIIPREEVTYTYENNNIRNENITKNIIENKKDIIFNDIVIIKTIDNNIYETKIVSKLNDHIITSNKKVILLKDIESIKRKDHL